MQTTHQQRPIPVPKDNNNAFMGIDYDPGQNLVHYIAKNLAETRLSPETSLSVSNAPGTKRAPDLPKPMNFCKNPAHQPDDKIGFARDDAFLYALSR